MTTTLLLRIASILSLIFAAGHLAGGLKKWSPMGQNAVLNSMTNERFQVMGVDRTYLDFFMGFGWSIGIAILLQSVLLWLMASIARANPGQVQPMIAAFALATLISGFVAWRFIFPVPAIFSGLVFIVLVAAYFVAA